ncbi:MAG TPA: division/cell wall cluster transcriptional repressor MraZ [Candidatus Paceibacterota bacterium]
MLIGEYTHNLDAKSRVSVPAKFREKLGKQVVVTHGLDQCLWVYPVSEWEKVADKLAGLSMGQSDTRGFNRFMLAGAVEVDVDALGRILIPEFLRTFAGLKTQVVFAGVHSRVEIWDESKWQEYKTGVAGKADQLAEKLGEIGAI